MALTDLEGQSSQDLFYHDMTQITSQKEQNLDVNTHVIILIYV